MWYLAYLAFRESGRRASYAGDDPSRAVFYDEDDRFLVERELTVTHHEVFAAT
ncbi:MULTISPECIES: hypothetical protein [unclassified Streptosporangium]|uniref:hypothetical protein n=1 Tax=unclassified Streptosporangium TaxID=2632669 RepID=UPI002E2C58A0|nr:MULTISPECIES: hypothetical protein [unclassified Streptosporangium]